MKRLIFTVMAVGLLIACGGGSTDTMRRLQQAEDVVDEDARRISELRTKIELLENGYDGQQIPPVQKVTQIPLQYLLRRHH